jgi:hypothetical protein
MRTETPPARGAPKSGFAEHDLVVGLCAVMRPEKAHDHLLQAMKLADDAGVRWKALLIGDGPLRPSIEQEILRLGLQDRVAITGFRSDVRADLAACDVVSLVSVTETFSIAAPGGDGDGAAADHEPTWAAPASRSTPAHRMGFRGGVTSRRSRGASVEGGQTARAWPRWAMRLVRWPCADYSVSTMIERYEELLAADAGPHGPDALGSLSTPVK